MALDTGVPAYQAGFMRFCVSGINPAAGQCKGFLWGQMRDPVASAASFDDVSKAATPNREVQVLSPAHAEQLFGRDSLLAHAIYLYFCQCGGYLGNSSLYVMPVLDDDGATAPEFTITIAGTPTTSGQLTFEIPNNFIGLSSGYYVIPVSSTDTPTTIAAAVAAEINADTKSLVSATSALGVVTLVGKHAGTVLNHTEIILNSLYGQALPPGITVAVASSVVGAGDPDISTALGNLTDCCYDCWGLLWQDPVAIELLTNEIASRWECGREQCYGHLFHAWEDDDAAAIVAYGNATNNAERTIIPMLPGYKYPGWALAAAWTGRTCCAACVDPGRPVVRDNGVLSCLTDSDPCGTTIFSMFEQEQIVAAGVAMWGFNRSGKMFIRNNVTNWKWNVNGDLDKTWTNTESRYIVPVLVGVITRFNNTYYSSSALVDDGVPIPAGSNATSPSLYKAHLVGYLEGDEDEDERATGILGTLLNDASLTNDIQVENDVDNQPAGFGDCHRLNVLFTARLIRQLLRIAVGIRVKTC